MQIIREADTFLRSAHFETQIGISDAATLQFEDANLLGFVTVHETADELVRAWQAQQDDFLRRHAARLRRDPSKAWNVYSVFLTSARADATSVGQLLAIEEDFRATRKIARANVVSRGDIQRALAPLLPLATIGAGQMLDPDKALRDRLDHGERRLFDMMRRIEVDDAQIVAALMEEAS